MSNVIDLKPKAPKTEVRKVATRLPNAATRSREHLYPDEVDKMIAAAKGVGRYGLRDSTLLLVAYRHGLRVRELIDLTWDQVQLDRKTLHVARVKNGTPSTHPLSGPETRLLRRLRRSYPDGNHVFATERLGPLSPSTVRNIVRRAGELAGLAFPAHPHMLRHACGYALANKGIDTRTIQHYLGHKNIQHTVRYTELAPGRFRGMWD